MKITPNNQSSGTKAASSGGKSTRHQSGSVPLLLGHRGARAESIENMPSALAHACYLQPRGLAGVEFDVQLSADGQLVIFHDDTLVRLGGDQARVDQLTLTEIRRIRIRSQSILALNDLLTYPLKSISSLASKIASKSAAVQSDSDSLYKAMMSFKHIELEIKTHERTRYPVLMRALENSLIAGGLAKLPLVLTSFDVTLMECLQRSRTLSSIPRGLLTEDSAMISQLSLTAKRLGCRQVGIHYPLIDSTLLRHCRRLNLSVSAWTVNDISEAKKLMALGVNVLITDYPTAFLSYV